MQQSENIAPSKAAWLVLQQYTVPFNSKIVLTVKYPTYILQLGRGCAAELLITPEWCASTMSYRQ